MQELQMRDSAKLNQRIAKLPLEYQVLLIDDLATAIENRLKFWERLANAKS